MLTLHGTDVSHNTLRAFGATGNAHGGGIWNASTPDSQDFTPVLNASDSTVTGNAIMASPGVDVRGGGVFTSEPVTFERVQIRGNRPDDTATTRATQATAR